MGNFLLAEPSLSDAAMDAYYVTHETAWAPASNLFLRQPKEVWETQNVTGTIELRFDMGTSASYDFVALLHTNATEAATITWQGSTSSTFSSSAWSSGSITLSNGGQSTYDRKHNFYKIGSTQTARYVRFQISDASNPDGVLRAGRMYVAASYQPTVNVQYGLGFGFEDDSLEVRTSAGERILRPIEPIPYLSFALQAFGSNAETEFYSNLHELMRKRGAAKDVVAIINPDHTSLDGAMLYYGTLQPRLTITRPAFQFFEASFELRGLV